ncbi:MAG: hypothetical protein R6X02_12635 [Enhygromyxa sp.]
MQQPTDKQRILITVKTYPTLSRTYGETVCTAGVREDGSWVRLYPVPFRRLDQAEQYKKYDWVECRLVRHTRDPRPESFRPADEGELCAVGHVDTRDQWRARRELLLKTARVWTRLEDLIAAAKANEASLAVFKPARIIDFVWEAEEERDWSIKKVREMREATDQYELFADNTWRETFKIIPKLPYKFYYRFEDADGQESRMRILDWEAGALFWNCLRAAGNRRGDEPTALAKVRQKYLDEFVSTDLHFYLGTTQQWHQVAPNPWLIVGALPIPPEPPQLGLF